MKKRKLTRREAMDFATKIARKAKNIERDYAGSLSLNVLLLTRLGGRAEFTQDEISDNKGTLRIMQDAEDKKKFIVLVETPAEDTK